MERRTAARKLTNTRVVIHHEEFDAKLLSTKDMSQGGVFVNTTTPISLQQGTRFEMTFMVDLGSITKLRKVAATVMQSTPEGFGCRFG